MPKNYTIDYKETVSYHFIVLQILGLWPPKNSSKLHTVYSIIITGFFFIAYLISETINIILVFPDIEKVTESSFLFLTHLPQLIKLCYMLKYKTRLRAMMEKMNDERFKPKNLKHAKMVRRTIRNSKASLFGFIFLCGCTVFFWAMFPLIDEKMNRMLPLKAWYPFDTKQSPMYEITYVYQIVAVMWDAAANVCFDTLASSGFMNYICMNLDVLNDTLCNVREEAKVALQTKRKSGVYRCEREYFHGEQLQKEMDVLLLNCMEHYLFIIE